MHRQRNKAIAASFLTMFSGGVAPASARQAPVVSSNETLRCLDDFRDLRADAVRRFHEIGGDFSAAFKHHADNPRTYPLYPIAGALAINSFAGVPDTEIKFLCTDKREETLSMLKDAKAVANKYNSAGPRL